MSRHTVFRQIYCTLLINLIYKRLNRCKDVTIELERIFEKIKEGLIRDYYELIIYQKIF